MSLIYRYALATLKLSSQHLFETLKPGTVITCKIPQISIIQRAILSDEPIFNDNTYETI